MPQGERAAGTSLKGRIVGRAGERYGCGWDLGRRVDWELMGYARGDSHGDKVSLALTLRENQRTSQISHLARRWKRKTGSSKETYYRFHDRSAFGTNRPA